MSFEERVEEVLNQYRRDMFAYYTSGAWEDGIGYPMIWDKRAKADLLAAHQQAVIKAQISELERWLAPKVEMIPSWEWPCYICGFDCDLLHKAQSVRLAELRGALPPTTEKP